MLRRNRQAPRATAIARWRCSTTTNDEINAADAVWSLLRLWRDANHDGVSQPWELSALDTSGIRSLSLSVKTDNRRDRYGNRFRWRAPVDGDAGHFSYDVILTRQ